VLDQDDLGPAELRSVISSARAMVGFRLHSNIIAISSGVPSINVYYVDKGRVFFDQVGMSRYALPIEDALEDGFGARVGGLLTTLLAESDEVRASLEEATAAQRASVAAAYDEALRVL
jgi:polysaccharide pyruvyl transferase WcaK-like protein